ncbi:S-adenosyl-L-methionine-dependent methyltransferase [Xylaria cf. heliscus]|nr:S-adenosyl-L-methionine-dependent methyltransferase [Xylaria cf. heliscus]
MSTSLQARTIEAFWGLLQPLMFLRLSASFIPQTIRHVLSSQGLASGLRTLLSPSRFQDAWFVEFWGFVGPNIRLNGTEHMVALLDGRTSRGADTDEPTGPGIGGVVIEIGAGAGLWVELFSDKYLPSPSYSSSSSEDTLPGTTTKQCRSTARTKITRVYGVEPNHAQHPALRRAVEAAGLQGVYEIVPVGIEDLSTREGEAKAKKWDGNIEPESVDCIVSVLCLCSIPEPERHIRELYTLLRPGGRWYIYEHVRVTHSWYMKLYQRIINIAWPHFIGGCQLCRETGKTLREAGPWTNIDIGQPPTEMWYGTVPHITGVFTK